MREQPPAFDKGPEARRADGSDIPIRVMTCASRWRADPGQDRQALVQTSSERDQGVDHLIGDAIGQIGAVIAAI